METLKNIGIGIGLVLLLVAMLVGSAMDIGRVDPFTGDPDEDREYCGNTPPSMMNEEELQRCAWLREEDEWPHAWEDDFATDSVEFRTDSLEP